MTQQIGLHAHDGQEAVRFADAILPVYEEVYAEPPYFEGPSEVGDFLDRFSRQVDMVGFRLVIASAGDDVAGFAFGYPLPAETRWWDGLTKPLPPAFTAEDGRRTFVIIELAVRAPLRRQGIGARLHARLLDGLTAERVALLVRPEPEAAPARAAYGAWGYRKVGGIQPWGDAPTYDAMVLDLS